MPAAPGVCYAPRMPRPPDLAYLLALLLASPWLAWRYVVEGKDRGGWFAKLTGRVERRIGDEPCVWLHAVSVGEALQLPGLIAALRDRRPGLAPVVTVSTNTGLAVARKKLSGVAVHRAPLDLSWAVRAFLRRVRPDALVLVELELWPNLVRECGAAGVPVAVANGRLSAGSFRGYRRLRRVLEPTFRRLAWVGAQTDEYAARFITLGTPAGRVTTTGSVKFDALAAGPDDARLAALRSAFGLNRGDPVLLAGSTGDPEEAAALDAYETLRKTHPALRLLIAPRHAERFERVAALVRGRGFALVRMSGASGGRQPPEHVDSAANSRIAQGADAPRSPVLLLDTLGDLSAAWGLATVAFVGGSLNGRGGQNMLEPAACGAAVTFGPNTRNFADVVGRLLAADAAVVVRNAGELAAVADRFLSDERERRAIGARARSVVRAGRGATAKTADAVCGLLPAADVPLRRAA